MADDPNTAVATTVAVAAEVAKELYHDVAHPAAAATGELLGLIPQAINTALNPVRKWVLEGQYKLDETKKILAEKLINTSPEKIISPEPYVAVPALQAISYSMDNEEIRNMYANLLASSMTDKVRNDVHPAFVEIIKQLSPDEARILKFLYSRNTSEPMITLRLESTENKGGHDIVKNFTLLFRSVPNLEQRDHNKVAILLDNLERQKIIEIHKGRYLMDKTVYEPLKKDFVIASYTSAPPPTYEKFRWDFQETYLSLTSFGKSFCNICISDAVKSIDGH